MLPSIPGQGHHTSSGQGGRGGRSRRAGKNQENMAGEGEFGRSDAKLGLCKKKIKPFEVDF